VIITTTPDDFKNSVSWQTKVNDGSGYEWDNYLKKALLSNLFYAKQGTKFAQFPHPFLAIPAENTQFQSH
jgi:hypothetical protein